MPCLFWRGLPGPKAPAVACPCVFGAAFPFARDGCFAATRGMVWSVVGSLLSPFAVCRVRAACLALALALATLWVPAPAFAENASAPSTRTVSGSAETVSILILSGEAAGLALSDVYAAARRALERHTAYRVAPLDSIRLAERQAAIRECAGKAACFAQKVRSVANPELLLTVSVDRIQDGLLLGLRLVDVRTERQLGAFGDEVPVGMSLIGVMERTLPEVVPSSVWGQVGDVEIQSDPAHAEVFMGERTCVSPCTLKRLVPQIYPVVVRKSGFNPWQGSVEIAPGETVHVQAELEKPSESLFSSPWFWTGVGAVVVATAVTSFVVLSRNDGPLVVCVAPSRADCDR